MLSGKRFLLTGISDTNSLACIIAKEILKQNGSIVCAGLGKTSHHNNLSNRAIDYLEQNYADFENAVNSELGKDIEKVKLDVSLDESISAMTELLKSKNMELNGFLHAIAMDKTIRNKTVKNILDVTAQEFNDTMNVSAYSLIALSRELLYSGVLQPESSIVSLSYIAAERSSFHPYKNISIAKAALERITKELAVELGRSHRIKVNALRFSPFLNSKAGGATLTTNHYDFSNAQSPLGNAQPIDLANETIHLLSGNSRITGEIRHVDGGYNILG